MDPDEHFYVSDEVYEHMNMVGRGRDLEDEWNGRFEAWREEFPELIGGVGSRMEWSSRARLRERAALLGPLRDPEARHAQGRGRRHERLQGLRPDHDRRGGGPRQLHQHRLFGRRDVLLDLRRAQHRLGSPGARDGERRKRHMRAWRDGQALRIDVPRSSLTTCAQP